MKTIATTPPIVLDDEQGHVRQLALRHTNASSPVDFPGWVDVVLLDETGAIKATLMRVHMTNSGGRVAADFPSCDAGYVITDAGGHITNG